MGCVYYVYHFHLGRKFLQSSCVRRPGFLVVIAMHPLFFVFGIQLAGLFEHLAFSVGVVGWFIGGAMNLTRAIEYAVQTGRARTISFEWLYPLSGFKASEFVIDYRVFDVVAIVPTLVSIALVLAIIVTNI